MRMTWRGGSTPAARGRPRGRACSSIRAVDAALPRYDFLFLCMVTVQLALLAGDHAELVPEPAGDGLERRLVHVIGEQLLHHRLLGTEPRVLDDPARGRDGPLVLAEDRRPG